MVMKNVERMSTNKTRLLLNACPSHGLCCCVGRRREELVKYKLHATQHASFETERSHVPVFKPLFTIL